MTKVVGMTQGTTTSAERTGSRPSWGDCGAARMTTKEYSEGHKRIFGEKVKKKVERTPEELAFLARKKERNKNRPIYPY